MATIPGMQPSSHVRRAGLLAINLLFLMVWGFAGLDKLLHGPPSWFQTKFGPTFLGKFPGVTVSFWLLAAAELAAFGLALVALFRGEFRPGKAPAVLGWAVAASLFVFVQLGFGLWLTNDFQGGAQMFNYFAGTVICLYFVLSGERQGGPDQEAPALSRR